MIRLRVILHRVFGVFFKSRLERELQDELQSHIEMQIEENIELRMNADEARFAALKKFGGVEQVKESYRDKRSISFLESFISDVRFAANTLIKRPIFASTCIIILMLGIGANTAIFSVINSVLFNAVPYPNAKRLVWVSHKFNGDELIGTADFLRWKMQSKYFDNMMAYYAHKELLTEHGDPKRIPCISATSDLFSVLGIFPQTGRAFTPDEDRPGGKSVVVISHDLSKQLFSSNEAAIGRYLIISGKKRLIIGVMPSGFMFVNKTEALLPLAINVLEELKNPMTSIGNSVIGLLKTGATLEQANEEGALMLKRNKNIPPNHKSEVTYLNERLVGHLKSALITLFIAVGLVLLIACINVSNMLTTHWLSRYKEMAIRAAVGAGKARLIRLIVIENLVLSLCGALAGLAFAFFFIRILISFAPTSFAQIKETTINIPVLWFTSLAMVLTTIITSILPTLYVFRASLKFEVFLQIMS